MRHLTSSFAILAILLGTTCSAAAEEKDRTVEFPEFESTTVEVNGDDVTVEVRWFNSALPVETADVDTLPASASKVWITAYQSLADGEYDRYVELAVSTKKAQQSADLQKKYAEHHGRPTNAVLRILKQKVVGEVRLESCVIAVFAESQKDSSKVRHLPFFAVEHSDAYRTVSRADWGDRLGDDAPAVAKLVLEGELAPSKGD